MSEVTIDLSGLSVMVGMPAGRDLPPPTVLSLLDTQRLCAYQKVPFNIGMIMNCAVVQWARDEVVNLFLKSDYTRLFWIDSDMVWNSGDFMRLLALSQYRDVICAAYPAKRDQPTFFVKWDAGGMNVGEYGLLEIRGIALGFTVMSRKVVEQVAAKAPRIFDDVAKAEVAEVFRIGRTPDGKRQGEDMAFFEDIRALGYKVWLDPSIDLGHVGQKIYTGSVRDMLTPR